MQGVISVLVRSNFGRKSCLYEHGSDGILMDKNGH